MSHVSKSRSRWPQEDRRRQILERAAALFVERGFEGVTMPDIAAATGIARPTVYKYFPSTEAMLRPLFEEALETLWSRLAPLLPAPSTPDPRLDVPAILTLLIEERTLLALLHSGGGPVFRRIRRTVFERLSALLAPYQPRDRHPYQQVMLSVLLGEMAFWAATDPAVDTAQLARALDVFVARGIQGPCTAPGSPAAPTSPPVFDPPDPTR